MIEQAPRPLIVSESVVSLVEEQEGTLLSLLAPGWPVAERWAETVRRCRMASISLRDAAWTVLAEVADGHPTCWV